MEIKITNKYLVEVPEQYFTNIIIDDKLKEYLLDCNIYDEESLKEYILDWIIYDNPYNLQIYDLSSNFDVVEDSNDVIIENINEVFDNLKYLIKKESCCSNRDTNFCPICGKKLK